MPITSLHKLNTDIIHNSWRPLVFSALKAMNPHYLTALKQEIAWLPGHQAIFNAFQLPLKKTHYILVGESPYPRPESANGFAFWDANVDSLWSTTGLSSTVNRATSLRNIIKMLLLASNQLSSDNLSQDAIAHIDKTYLVQTGNELFENFMKKGILLLNASLVLSSKKINEDAQQWQPFMEQLLLNLKNENKKITLLLFGKIAEKILKLPEINYFPKIIAEHPYNLSFITNKTILDFFKPLNLLNLI